MFLNKVTCLLCRHACIFQENNCLFRKRVFGKMSTNLKMDCSMYPETASILNENNKRPLETEDIVNDESKIQKIESETKLKKKNYAMMIGYNGHGYYGMQRNINFPTIEDKLLTALFNVGLLTEGGFKDPKSIHFQRAARTDKGVSALRQVVNLMMPGSDADLQKINGLLPDEIRVFGIKRVTKRFNSKNNCNARTYNYVLPTFAFASEGPLLSKDEETYEARFERLQTINGKPYHEYRLSAERLERLNSILKLYEGTHNFHNYTAKVKPLDPRAKRYIMRFSCIKTFISNNMEYAHLEVKGQSFMQHQIRKMIAFVIVVMRDILSEEELEVTFEHAKYDVPRAPGLGLALSAVHYDNYDRRYGEDGMHVKLDWAEYEDEVNMFWEKHIFPQIVQTEMEEKTTLNWIGTLYEHRYFSDDKCLPA